MPDQSSVDRFKKSRNRSASIWIAIALVIFGGISCGLFLAAVLLFERKAEDRRADAESKLNPRYARQEAKPPPAVVPVGPQPRNTADVIDSVEQAVVRLDVRSTTGGGIGSGFLIDQRGFIATNYHVISGASAVSVVFRDGTTCDARGYVAVSPGRDLAVLAIDPANCVRCRPLQLSASPPARGEDVLAFGSPNGLSGSVTEGIVSAVRRGQDVADLLRNAGFDFYTRVLHYETDATWIQTSAAISRGNSGGPLVDQRGHVLGVNTWSHPFGEDLNFAISTVHISQLIGNTTQIRRFSELPAPRQRASAAAVQSDGARTLDYWNSITALNRTFANKMESVPPSGPDMTREAVAKQHYVIASYYDEYAQGVKKLDISGVDGTVARAAQQEAAIATEASSAHRRVGSTLLGESRAEYDMARAELRQVSRRIDVMNSYWDLLRVSLTEKYGLSFPYIFSID